MHLFSDYLPMRELLGPGQFFFLEVIMKMWPKRFYLFLQSEGVNSKGCVQLL